MEPARMRESYKECVRNHAARLGTYACDGCCEYSPDALRPNVLLCNACGCHRNFHRKVGPNGAAATYGSINARVLGMPVGILRARRRKRSKFTAEQKAQMGVFAARIGWKVRKQEVGGEDEVSKFCKDIGITRQVFKIWIHNHKGSAAAATSTSNTAAAPADVEGEGDGGCVGGEGEEELKGSASMEEEK